jgi:putative MATE family efflux protein
MNGSDNKIGILRDEKISSALLKLGLPTIVGMMVSALYSVVDAYFVGWLGTSQMGAVSVVFPVVQVIIGLGMTFGSGSASYISRLLGEGNSERASQTASTALFTSLIAGGLSITLCLSFIDPVLRALGATETIFAFAKEYALIYILFSILTIFNVTVGNIVASEGAVRLTMTGMILGGGLNVLLCPLFIYTLHMGVRGAAVATSLAQGATALLYLRYLLSGRSCLRISLRRFVPDRGIYGEILKVGLPNLAFQLLSGTSMGLTNSAAGRYGDAAVAAMGIVTRLMTLGSYVVYGYAKGFQPFAGYNYGAGRPDRLNGAVRISLFWSTGFCGLAALVMMLFPEGILSLFGTGNPAFLDAGARALRANGLTFPLFGFQIIYMTLFLALGRGREGGLLGVARQGLFFIPLILILPGRFGMTGVICAQPLADLLASALTALLVFRSGRSLAGGILHPSEQE